VTAFFDLFVVIVEIQTRGAQIERVGHIHFV
jgi:hypothetical protein